MAEYSTSGFAVDRRRRLFACLGPVLGPGQVWEALWLWEREFAVQAPFAIAGYATRLAEHFKMEGAEQALLQHVTLGIQGETNGLPDDPITQMLQHPFSANGGGGGGVATVAAAAVAAAAAPAATATAAPPPALSPELTVFNSLIGEILVGTARRKPNLDRELRRYLSGFKVGSDSARGELAEWGRGQSEVLTSLSEPEMRQIVNAAYVWICEELGPTVVDRVFGDAVRSTEALPEATSFSPRKFL